jgi:hypothetical protein
MEIVFSLVLAVLIFFIVIEYAYVLWATESKFNRCPHCKNKLGLKFQRSLASRLGFLLHKKPCPHCSVMLQWKPWAWKCKSIGCKIVLVDTVAYYLLLAIFPYTMMDAESSVRYFLNLVFGLVLIISFVTAMIGALYLRVEQVPRSEIESS